MENQAINPTPSIGGAEPPKPNHKKAKVIAALLTVFSVTVVCALLIIKLFPDSKIAQYKTIAKKELGIKIDDWQYNQSEISDLSLGLKSGSVQSTASWGAPMMEADNIGFSVGGAKDVNNFRMNIEEDYLPIPTDITYEGLFYDYYFDTGQSAECKKLFCPSYSYAISPDPISGKEEYYLSVGLNSGIKEADFKRKKLNLTIVLDISGSMGSSFNKYYYDRFGNKHDVAEDAEDEGKSKMEIAAKSVVSLLEHLGGDDRFGMVLFDDQAYTAKEMRLVKDTDMESIKNHILEIRSRGGTNMSAGMRQGTELYGEYLQADKREYENRIIFLTDAMPNRGATDKDGLLGMAEENAVNGIYSTFIGVGVDFNTELVEYITKIKGANYYSVHSAKQFTERMDEEFEYMVTPLVFNLQLKLEAAGYKIDKVYGSPEANEATGEIMKVNTLFPSKSEGGETKGGIVLLKLTKLSDNASLKLKTTYEDRQGQAGGDEAEIRFLENQKSYPNTGIRKGIVLTRYINLIKDWVIDERSRIDKTEPIQPKPFIVNSEDGIIIPDIIPFQLGEWERQSSPLKVDAHYGKMFSEFKKYYEQEIQAIQDDEMKQEIEVLEKLILESKYEENKEEVNTQSTTGALNIEPALKTISSEDCLLRQGRILNIQNGLSCNEAERLAGRIQNYEDSYICCITN